MQLEIVASEMARPCQTATTTSSRDTMRFALRTKYEIRSNTRGSVGHRSSATQLVALQINLELVEAIAHQLPRLAQSSAKAGRNWGFLDHFRVSAIDPPSFPRERAGNPLAGLKQRNPL